MKAIVQTMFGPPETLQLREVDKPAPKDGEVLIKIHAASLNSYDWRLLVGDPAFIRLMGKPKEKIIGADVAGRVEAVGGQVTRLKPGDEVYGDLAGGEGGSLAEYACGRETALALKPANLSFEEAAAVPMAGVTALQGLRDVGKVRSGQKVLVNGASGGVGTFAVQIARVLGAEVTAVTSTRNLEMARSIGADQVIDYTKEDFTRRGERYDLILGVNGYHPILAYRRALKPEGMYVMAGGEMAQIFQALLLGPVLSMWGKKKMTSVAAKNNWKDLEALKELIEAGKVRPVIDRQFRLQEAAEALRYLGGKHAHGKVVITIEGL
jgi:NADPH:quinone reductase-like Zn-dependent oxidoreductase